MAPPQLEYNRNRARQIAQDTWHPWANPVHVRDHVRKLLETSTYQAIAKAANVGQMTVWEITNGARPVIKAETAKALLARVSPNGARGGLTDDHTVANQPPRDGAFGSTRPGAPRREFHHVP